MSHMAIKREQSSAEESSDNMLPHKLLSVLKLNQFITQYLKPLKVTSWSDFFFCVFKFIWYEITSVVSLIPIDIAMK